jgi:hypothetical protein
MNLSWQGSGTMFHVEHKFIIGRCQLKLSLFTVKKKIIHKVWLYQILLLDLCIVNYKKNNDGNYTKKEMEKNNGD